MSYVDQFGDFMSGDFLTWIHIDHSNEALHTSLWPKDDFIQFHTHHKYHRLYAEADTFPLTVDAYKNINLYKIENL